VAPTRDRDLVQAVRAELAAIDPPRRCCRAAERAGLGLAARGRARSPVVARLAVRLADEDLGGAESPVFDWSTARSHCRAAWLRGRFLSAGSLSLGSRGAHLELVVPPAEADELARRLEDGGFPARRRMRRGRVVMTWKRTETILAFLRSIGAGTSLLEVESRLVMRQLQGHLNRVINAENANLERSVASSARQLVAIDRLEVEGRLADLPPTERAVADERRASPEATFSELAARLGLSRARVQRAFDRLESAATTTAGDL
jgi:DNA-binding protein WhiA